MVENINASMMQIVHVQLWDSCKLPVGAMETKII